MSKSEFVKVAVDAPMAQLLTYHVPKELIERAEVGSKVYVPLGRRQTAGVIVSEEADILVKQNKFGKEIKVKSVISVSDEPKLGAHSMRWLKWLAQYYLHAPGQVYSMAFSPGDETRKRKSKKKSPTDSVERENTPPPIPNKFQKAAIEKISEASNAQIYVPFLLYGVTGSGKTEVYLQSIEQVLLKGKQALVLVPEISLTPQLIKRFIGRFGENVAVLHSHLTARERSEQWWSVVRGKKQILVGARSALFCPLENLGLIVVDEEHEPSFKQEEQLKYNARDAAIVRAHFSSCPVVLGSATPSLESWQNSISGKFQLLELPERVENRALPHVEVVDMRLNKLNRDANLPFWMSKLLFSELKQTLEAKQQSALFLNRRGFAQFVLCPGCGYTESCPNCSVTLTVHSRGSRLVCHYCAFEKPLSQRCTSCKQQDFKSLGLGTEKVFDDLQILFPTARLARADRDEITTREDLENLLNKINLGEVDMIVGTQMIAKGHDFPNLTLVGTVLADVGLHLPDFRSSERTFQLLTQVAGRAGRHLTAGRVVVQTYIPEHIAIRTATTHDFRAFAAEELRMREELNYPPYGKLATIRIQGAELNRVEETSEIAKKRLLEIQKNKSEFKAIEILGPCEAALAKIRNKHRYHVLLKGPSSTGMNLYLQTFLTNQDWVLPGVKISVDVDPLHLM
jgi:primosomal protein N' (replication factor Y)